MSITQSKAEETIANDTTISGQVCIDALRDCNYLKLCKLTAEIGKKYTEQRQLNAEELKLAMIYELCKANINDEDADRLNFLFNYFDKNKIYTGEMALALSMLTEALPVALSIKSVENYQQQLDGIDFTSVKGLEAAICENSSLNKLIDSVCLKEDDNKANKFEDYQNKINKIVPFKDFIKSVTAKDFVIFQQFENSFRLDCPQFRCAILQEIFKPSYQTLIAIQNKLINTKRSKIGINILLGKEKKIIQAMWGCLNDAKSGCAVADWQSLYNLTSPDGILLKYKDILEKRGITDVETSALITELKKLHFGLRGDTQLLEVFDEKYTSPSGENNNNNQNDNKAEESIANDTPISGQACIDALRVRDYSKVEQLVHDIQEKYKGREGGDFTKKEFFYILTYELCKSDINKDDIKELNFLYSYIKINNLSDVERDWGLNQLVETSAHALAVKAIPLVEKVLTQVSPTTTKEVINHCEILIDLTKEMSYVNNLYDYYHQNINKDLDNRQFCQQFQEKDIRKFIQFQSDVRKEQGMQNFSCQILSFHKNEYKSQINIVKNKLCNTKRSKFGRPLPENEKKLIQVLDDCVKTLQKAEATSDSESMVKLIFSVLQKLDVFNAESNSSYGKTLKKRDVTSADISNVTETIKQHLMLLANIALTEENTDSQSINGRSKNTALGNDRNTLFYNDNGNSTMVLNDGIENNNNSSNEKTM